MEAQVIIKASRSGYSVGQIENTLIGKILNENFNRYFKIVAR
jgi:hypothetical protein